MTGIRGRCSIGADRSSSGLYLFPSRRPAIVRGAQGLRARKTGCQTDAEPKGLEEPCYLCGEPI